MRHAPEAQLIKLGEVAGKLKILGVSGDSDVVVGIRLAKPLMSLVRVVASELLVVNGLGQLSGLSTMPLLALYNWLVKSRWSADTCPISVPDVAGGVLPFWRTFNRPLTGFWPKPRTGGSAAMHIPSNHYQGSR
jgi:hypothetical protein